MLYSNCVFSVFDRVKIKIEATDSFPMEIATVLMITKDDMDEFTSIIKE